MLNRQPFSHSIKHAKPFILLFTCLVMFLLASPTPVAAYIPTGYQEYYVNGYEEHLWRMYLAINDNDPDPYELTSGRMCSTVSLVATADYQVIYYDHWEDGYESDLFNPIQTTTEVYGDGVLTNGGTGSDLLVAGDDINLVSINNDTTINGYVPVNPNRNPADFRYDGGDRVISTGGPVDLAHAIWPYSASWVGDAFEIYSRQAQEGAYSYRLPIGEDLYTFGGGNAGSYGDFRDAYLQLQAFEDNTTVLIDNGTQTINMTLNRGQTYSSMGYIDSTSYAGLTINSGTHVHSNKATQAVLITGADGTYQGRSFTVLSDRLWGSDYVVPVPSGSGTSSPAEVYLSNPNDFPITVNGYDRFASATFTISPTGYVSATVPYSRKRPGSAYVPGDSAARFTSPDGVFGVFVAAETSNSTYDWGASGMPSRYLTRDYYVSWAPGTYDLSANGSPAWVTPLENDTVFFVDYNTTSGLDGVADQTFVLDVMEQQRVFDPDNDNTGMHIWASSDFTVFWGEDPRTAGPANPYLDIGLTVLPAQRDWLAPMLALEKTVDPTILPYTGGTVTFTLVAQAINALISNVNVTDTLPANWSYVASSTLIRYPDGSSSSQNPTINGQDLIWNLSYDLDINQSLTITFRAQTSTAGSYDDTAYDGFEAPPPPPSYGGGSGWTGNWTEVGEGDGAGAGRVMVVGTESGVVPYRGSYQLRIWDDSRRVYRVVNTNGFSAPILRFMRRYQVSWNDENFFLEISPNGSTWTQVRNWVDGSGDENTWVEENVDLTPYKSATTYIRFSSRQATTMEEADWIYIDQVKVYEGGLLNTNRAEASGAEPYSGALFNPTDEEVVYVSPLKLTKAVDRGQAEIGNILHYTLTYQNTSDTSSATNVILRDSVPVRYVTFLSATGGGTFDAASGTINWSLGVLAPLSSGSVSFQVQVNSFVKDSRVILNRGRIESDGTAEARSNEVSTVVVAPELEVIKDGPTVAYRSERITYTISYENTGGAKATNVLISDTLPVSGTYVAGSLQINTGSGWVARGSVSGGRAVIQPGVTAGTVEAGETGMIRFSMDLNSGLTAGELIMNWAAYDRDLDHPRDTNLVVTRISDLLISKAAQQTAVAPGDLITYTLTYRNTGTVAHDNIVLREPIPDYTRFVGANTPAGLTLQYSVDNGLSWSTGTPPANTTHIRWLDASLAAGAQETVGFSVRVNSTLLPDTTIRNIATISSTRVMATVREPIPSNQVEVPTVELWVNKHVAQSSAVAGTVISYTISYGNRGSAGVSSVQLLDTLPAGTSYVAGSIWGTGANASGAPNLVWNVGAVAAGQGTRQVGYAALLSPSLAPGSSVVNTANISSMYGVETSLPVTTTVTTLADLSVSKTDAIDPVLAGRTLTYTITYANAGPSEARNVTIVDTMPLSATFVTGSEIETPSILGPTQSGSTLTWSPGMLAAGASGTIVFSILTHGLSPATLTNTVVINSSTSDPAPLNNSDSEATAVTRTVSFQSMTYSVNEGAGPAYINVTLSSASPTPVSVNYATSNGTAIAGADYTTATGTLVFPANTQTLAFPVPIINDSLNEDSETVNLSLSSPVGVALASPTFATLTIIDNDPLPTAGFSGAPYSVNEGVGSATIVVNLNTASGRTVTVNYATSDNTATAGADYTAASGTLSFAPGVTSRSFAVPVIDDPIDEPNETVNLTLSGATNANIGAPNPTTLMIVDNDAATIGINDVSVDEGNSGTTNMVFNVSLSTPSAYVVTVNYTTLDGSATAGSDYNSASSTLTFNPGVTSRSITITVLGDMTVEDNETLYVNLSGAVNAPIADNQGLGTILNDDGHRLTISDVTVTEGDSGSQNAVFVVTLFPPHSVNVTVDYATANGTATAPADYTATNGTLTFNPGRTTHNITVTVQSDLLDEDNEVYTVNLSNAVNATIADNQGQGTITDNDPMPSLSFSATTYSVNESGGTATIVVNLSAASGRTVAVNYATSNGTAIAGADYTTSTGTLSFNPGVTSQSFTVPILDDLRDENNETVNLALSGPTNATLGTPNTAQLTIVDNDPTPTLSWSSATYSVNEGAGSATAVVNLSAASNLIVTVNYATSNGTATAGSDYTTSGGTLTFNPGVTSQSFTVPILEDARDENDETVNLTLSAAANASIAGTNPAVLTIVDNDPTPSASLSSASYTVNEGDGSLAVTVTLSAASNLAISINYATSNGTAIAGADYTASNGTLSFNPGVTLRTFSVPIANDSLDELDETFGLALSNPVNVTLAAPYTATVTIQDNDPPPALSINDVTVTEGNSGPVNATFNVALSAPSGLAVTVTYNTVDNTAAAGQDYTAVSGTLTFDPGVTTRQVVVPVLGDVLDEINETYYVALSSPTNATIADNLGLGTITDDDAPPQVRLSSASYSVDEGDGTATITVTLDAPSGQTVNVDYATSDSTALAGLDYAGVSGTVSFAPGIVSVLFSIPITDDALYENDEWLEVSLSDAVNASLGLSTATVTILNNDTPPVVDLDRVSYDVLEDIGSATITVTLDAVSALTVSVDYATSDGTALDGSDYSDASGTLTFAPGVTRLTFSIPITDDATDEEDETIVIDLSNPISATLGPNTPGELTIIDNDGEPGVRFSAASYTVGEAQSSAIITVSLSNISGLAVTVNYTVTDGTANSSDYTAANGVLTIPAGDLRTSFAVNITNDTIDEPDETVNLALGNPVNAHLSTPSQAVLTIVDNDDPPVLNFSTESQPADEDAGTVTVMIQLNHGSSSAIQAPFALSGAAISNTDYTISPSPIVILPGALSATILVTLTDDALNENDEDIVITMEDPLNATRGVSDTHTVTILDNDVVPSISFSSASQSVSEEVGTVTVTVQLNAVAGRNVLAPFTLSGTAANNDDYTISASPLLIPAGSASADILVTVIDGTLYELDETIIVTLGISPTNAVRGDPYIHTITLEDNDAANIPTVSFAAASQSQWEDVGNFNIAVALTRTAGVAVSVPFTVSGTAANGDDYTVSASPVVIPAGSLSANIVVSVISDTLYEYPETIIVTLGTPTNANLGEASVHTVTLNDDDSGNVPTVNFSSESQAASEAVGTLSVVAQLDRLSGRDVTVNYLLGGSATSGLDYTAAPHPLLIPAGSSVATITLTVNDDTLDETNETIVITMDYPDEAYRGTPYIHTATIADNDDLPSVAFIAASQSASEGSLVTITFQLNTLSGLDVQVPFSLGGTASGADYTIGASPLLIPAGSLSADIVASLVDDELYEDDETIIVTIGNPVNATRGVTVVQTVTLLNTDATPLVSFAADSQTVAEDVGTATLAVQLNHASVYNVSAPFTRGGTASDGEDYIIGVSSVIILAGALSTDLNAAIVDDDRDELDETLVATLDSPTNATLGTPAVHTVTILDNDLPTIEFDNMSYSIVEGNTALVTVTLSALSDLTITVDYTTLDGKARAPADYAAASETLTFTPGITTATFSVLIAEDDIDEEDENIILNLSQALNAVIGAVNPAVLYILDDDGEPGVRFSALNLSVGESAGSAVVQVSLVTSSSFTITVDYAAANGTASDGVDYIAQSGSLTFIPGSLQRAFTITILPDVLDEADETVLLTLSNPVSAHLSSPWQATLTILDDDATPQISFSSASQSAPENAGAMIVVLQLSAISARDVTASFLVGGTATQDVDYTLTASPLFIPAGSLTATLTLTMLDDAVYEDDETVVLTIVNPVNAERVEPYIHTATILNDDVMRATIYGVVFDDRNGDGDQDDGEAGIPGVTIALDETTITQTDASGNYTLYTPLAGPHTVVETDPYGYRSTTPNSVVVEVELEHSYRVDFGDIAETVIDQASIYGTVFNDRNSNGTQDNGELGLANVLITLDGVVTSTTNLNGGYTFSTTVAGPHSVVETDPALFRSTTPNTVQLNVTLGASYQVNFGDIAETVVDQASIYGTVFNDRNGNGTQDSGEEGIAGVSIVLYGATAVSTTSGMYGTYALSTTTAGSYDVIETDLPGYRSTTPNRVVLNVALGSSYRVDFGDIAETVIDQASIYGTVFNDRDSNGTQDNGEEGLVGVLITLDNLVTTTTNLNGGYTFSTTQAGAHTVVETDPAGYRSTTPNEVQRNVTLGESYQVDFGDTTATGYASIYGTVFNDADGDGVQGAGEEGIQGVVLSLDGTASTTTNLNGGYTFSTTVAGAHTVVETDPAGYRSTTPNEVVVNVELGESYQVDFGDVLESEGDDWASIYGTVFDDQNNNGQRDAGELGLANVSITLDGAYTVTTNLNGSYTFSTTVAGAHTVIETDPPGYRSTTPNSVVVNVSLGQSYQVDFGDTTASGYASIYGTVFNDADGDGIQDSGEAGIPNVSIMLDGVVTATTNAYGGYTFATSQAGAHTVVEIDPPGYRSTTPNTVQLNVTLGNSYQVDFGDTTSTATAAIFGTVFDDQNSNGVQDNGETGIAGVTIVLDGAITTTTNANGGYTFSTTVAGAHAVVETDPAGFRSTTPNAVVLNVTLGRSYQVDFGDIAETVVDLATIYGTVFNDRDGDGVQDTDEAGIPNVSIVLDGVVTATTNAYGGYTFATSQAGAHTVVEIDPVGFRSTTPNTVQLNVTLGHSYQVNFGDTSSASYASILGTVFEDTNSNGLQDVGETGLTNVLLTLDGGATTTTNANGGYTFATAVAGAHTVVETDPAGFRSTTPNTVTLNVALGNSYQVDFGDISEAITTSATIYGTVFNDIDSDGIQDAGETGIQGVTLTLSSGAVTFSGPNGGYTFVIEQAGAYTVTETDLPDYNSTTPNIAVVPGVVLGQSYRVDFGDKPKPAAIEGFVFEDTDGDGVQDLDEDGIGGVTITLDGSETTQTNINGYYIFSPTLPGFHTLIETDPNGFRSTTPNTVTLEAKPGKNYQVNFGDVSITEPFATIMGTVFDDKNINGAQDTDEPGLANVVISLDSPQGITTTTNSYGNYTFSTEQAGAHTVVETNPAGYRSTTPDVVTLDVELNRSYQVNFGDVLSSTTDDRAIIYGTVFDDRNGDGVQSGAEPGIPFVTVMLDDYYVEVTTNPNGGYTFATGEPGPHKVAETNPPGYRSTTPDVVVVSVTLGDNFVVNFGDILESSASASLYGTVFDDKNGNGVQDDDETGLAGVELSLDGAATTTSNLNGGYTFSTTVAGSHTVVETDPAGYHSTTPNSVVVNVTLGHSYQVDFGDVADSALFASIYGTVFDDKNGDGVQGDGESGLANVVLTLDGSYAATTNPNGGYTFATSQLGYHTVVESDPPGYRSTTPNRVVVNVTAYQGYQVDFGDVADSALFASIYGTVFDDKNGNGTQDANEAGLGGAALRLDGGAPITSDANGAYTFRLDTAGAHTVVETNPSGYRSTTSDIVVVNVEIGQGYQVDFGDVLESETAFANVYGTVFNDVDGDGVLDPGETGLSGVRITLDGNPSWTNAYGSYSFVVRAAGAHTLIETDPAGFRSTTPNTVRLDVTLGQSYPVDFGDVSTSAPFASIYGTVYDDKNGNGSQDSGETGLAGVTLTLDGSVTTTTNLNGSYTFAVYGEGYHVVVETNPAGYRSTTPDRVVLTVAHGQSYELNFGDTQSSAFASIYGTVFLDKNSNGIQDDDEGGIPNVSVALDSFKTWTNQNGTYTFVTQQIGPRIIVETNPSGYRSTTPDRVVLNVELGKSYQVDFGDTRATDSATIYGTVYDDKNGSGSQDAGETGLAGVTLTLDGSVTTTTNLNGGYALSTTVAGAHTLVETDLPGYRSTTANQVVLNVALGQSYVVDFGDVLTTANFANVYGTVFNDKNSNGVQDAGENGIPNVSVTLDGASTVKTNSYGLYAFAAVAAGPHSVVETDPAGYRSTTPNTVQLEVVSGQSYQVDFGDVPINTSGNFATLYGTVYNDKNGNGVQEIGEPGLAGVTITLDGSATATTNLNGGYTFSTTVAGVHTLVETDPPGYRSTTPNTVVLDVLLGVSYQVDFGDIAETVTDRASLYGTVFNDNNSNGLHDPGEVGIPNVEITLDGQAAIRTNAYGAYAFGVTMSGTHILVETDPAGYRSTTPNTVVVSVTLGNSYEVDFGDVSQTQTDFATLYGTVYDDLDGDGRQDTGEPGLASVTITLDSAVQTLTNVYGGYTFSTTQGAHTLVETNPPGYRSTTPDVVHLDVALGDSYQVDFGDTTRPDLATVYGTVFNDLDGDGIQDVGETGIAGVTVRLDEEAATTNANGGYTFSTPEEGHHVLVETNLAGYRSTTPDTLVISLSLGTSLEVNFGDVRDEDGRDWATLMGVVFDDLNSNGVQDADELGLAGATITLDGAVTTTTNLNGGYTLSTTVAGPHSVVETNLPGYRSTTPDLVQLNVALGGSYQVNFGDVLAEASFATIYGTVFNDLNGDGLQGSGETGLAGVIITLDEGVTTTTNLNGGYTFSTTLAGVHVVAETDPPLYHSTTPNSIQLDVEMGHSYQVDFGDTSSLAYASIFGTVYRDMNHNQTRDVGETGIEGVLITLNEPDGSVVTRLTGVYGTYVFSTTLAGPHTIIETDPPGYLSTTPNSRTRNVVTGNSYQVDFGDRPSAIIVYGTVFEDKDGNGLQDAGEAGIGGVTITLDSLITTTTDLTGTYLLTTAIPGAHTVIEIDPPGYRSTTPNSVVLSATLGSVFQVNFGDVSTAITTFASIYGTVFNDRDGSGVQGAGETGLAGVLITLDGERMGRTNMYGNYTFSTTLAGPHLVVETDPPGYRSTTPNSVVVSVTLDGSTSRSYQVDFGDIAETAIDLANIYGTVFEDNNGNGVQDSDEPGIAGVSVRLEGPQAVTATTNLNGAYAMSTTVAGLYTVVETDLPCYRSTTPNSIVISVTLGHSYQVDFGDTNRSDLAIIYGTVFNDNNSNGVQEQNEEGIESVLLTLNGVVTATTGVYGSYTFVTHQAGAHTLVEIDPPGYRSTTPNIVRLDVVLGNSYQVDFGDVLTSTSGNFASLYGTVFNDNNGNGVQDAREVGIPHVTITLDGVVSTTTNINGSYTFSTTKAGPHRLVETDLPNYRSTTPNTVMLNVMLNNSYQADFGDVLSSISLGFATLYGTVFEDTDGNGVQDMGEAGLAGVVLSLDEAVTTTTNLLGGYTFSTTVAGPHTLVETDPPGYRSTTPNTILLNVALNNSYQADFGDVSLSAPFPFASIFGTVFDDNNRNGTRDAGEVGLAGVSLSLNGSTEATTNLNGGYTFSTTVAGLHTVLETDLPGYRSTTPNTVTLNVAAQNGGVINTSYQADFGDAFVICDPDSSEDDDTPASAKPLTLTHNFCEDAGDWMTFAAAAETVYTITTNAWGQRADTVLTLYDADSRTTLAGSDDYEGSTDFSSQIVWTATAPGLYYLHVGSHGGVTGHATEYNVWLEHRPLTYTFLYLPVIMRNLTGVIVTEGVTLTGELLAPTGVITHTLPDAYEIDDTWQQAKLIEPGELQTRTFDSPTPAFPANAYLPDKDYVRFQAYPNVPVTFTVLSHLGTTPTLQLYDSDGNSPYQVEGRWLTGSLSLVWTPPDRQVYYVAAYDVNAAVPATYTLRMDRQPVYPLYLPVILRNY